VVHRGGAEEREGRRGFFTVPVDISRNVGIPGTAKTGKFGIIFNVGFMCACNRSTKARTHA